MTRLWRMLLCWLARLAGIIGLVAGGKSLVKYVTAWVKDPYFDSFSYNDLVFSGGVIFLLSLMVLIFAEVCQTLGRAFNPAKEAAGPGKGKGVPAKSAEPVAPPPATVENEADRESADEKLTRLLKQKDK